MKRIIIISVLAVATLTSCTFMKIDTKALRALMEREGVEVNVGKTEVVVAKGNIKTEVKSDLPQFYAVESNISADIEYSSGDQFCSISAPESILQYISAEVIDGRLVLKLKGARIRNLKDVSIVIRTPEIRSIEVNGAGDIDMNGHIDASEFSLAINGAGDVEIDDMKADKFKVTVNGAGDIDVEKIECGTFRAGIYGAGDLDAMNVESQDMEVIIEGAGECELAGHAVNGDFSVSGAGSIDISELRVDNVNTNTSGFAKIIR